MRVDSYLSLFVVVVVVVAVVEEMADACNNIRHLNQKEFVFDVLMTKVYVNATDDSFDRSSKVKLMLEVRLEDFLHQMTLCNFPKFLMMLLMKRNSYLLFVWLFVFDLFVFDLTFDLVENRSLNLVYSLDVNVSVDIPLQLDLYNVDEH